MTQLALVAALARNRVIGDGTGMPWHLPEDLAHFRRVTQGHAVIMGRRTWESLPPRLRPLPGRRNLVVTRQADLHAALQAAGAEPQASLDDALARCSDAPRAFVIGGGQLYAQALPRVDELLLTLIDRDFDGTTLFPPYEQEFECVEREAHRAAPPNDFGFAFTRWRRKAG